jgi:hypothetical protein
MLNSFIVQGLGTALLVSQGFNASSSVLATGGMSQGGSPQSAIAGSIASDTFTGAAGTPLPSHTPDSGGSWTLNSGTTGSAVLTNVNSVRSSSNAVSVYYHSASPPGADYDVTASVVPHAYSTQLAGVAGRISATASTWYVLRYNGTLDQWELQKCVGGSVSTLATSTSLPLTQTRTSMLRLRGSTISGIVDGTIVASVTDGSITAANQSGLWFQGSSTDSNGIYLDSWSATTAAPVDLFAQYNPLPRGGVALGGIRACVADTTAFPSGGVGEGGSSGPSRIVAINPAGGESSGGQALVSVIRSTACDIITQGLETQWLITQGYDCVGTPVLAGTGGLALGGVCSCAAHKTVTPAGGVGQGGSSQPSRIVTINSAGGQAIGGQALVSATSSSAGDIITQGLKTQWLISQGFHAGAPALVATGGTALGGSALPNKPFFPVATGGMALGGHASSFVAHLISGGGTVITLGLGTPQLLIQGYNPQAPGVQVIYPAGGVRLGGSNPAVSQDVHWGISGGLRLGGAASARSSVLAVASGGTRLDGFAGVSGAFVIAAAGRVAQGGSFKDGQLIYHIYRNSGQGDPVNYAIPVAAVMELTWTSAVLGAPGQFKLGVRAYNPLTNLEEQNVDAVIELMLDAGWNDVTGVPLAPVGLRAFALVGGKIHVEWSCPVVDVTRQPIGYHVYLAVGSVPNYSQPVATVPWSSQRNGSFSADLSGLTVGASYAIGVRAYNGSGEESNTIVLSMTADGTPPAVVDSLQAVATNQES